MVQGWWAASGSVCVCVHVREENGDSLVSQGYAIATVSGLWIAKPRTFLSLCVCVHVSVCVCLEADSPETL